MSVASFATVIVVGTVAEGVKASHAVPPAFILTEFPAPGVTSRSVLAEFATHIERADIPVRFVPPRATVRVPVVPDTI